MCLYKMSSNLIESLMNIIYRFQKRKVFTSLIKLFKLTIFIYLASLFINLL